METMQRIVDYIKSREGQAVKLSELENLTHAKPGYIKRLIVKAQSEGIPICYNKGDEYTYSEADSDILNTIFFHQRRAKEHNEAVKGLMLTLRKN